MILQHLTTLNAKKIVLASASPQRHRILSDVGLRFEVTTSGFAEDVDPASCNGAGHYAQLTATQKASLVADTRQDAFLVIGADTVVELDGELMEKPEDAAHAIRMLSKLSGKTHNVHTGVAIIWPSSDGAQRRVVAFHETTSVTFAPLEEAEIRSYVESGEAFNKAGSYGIQGRAAVWVSGLSGCYFNVMGFPVHRFASVLAQTIADKV